MRRNNVETRAGIRASKPVVGGDGNLPHHLP